LPIQRTKRQYDDDPTACAEQTVDYAGSKADDHGEDTRVPRDGVTVKARLVHGRFLFSAFK
jgi:hypothetical protein